MRRFLWVILLILLAFGACSKNRTEQTIESKLAKADELYAQKKYARAATLYDEVSFERKSASTAYAILRQADSYFLMNKFADARLKYQHFIDSFPDHANASDAYFRIGQCLYEESLSPAYDQDETISSINAFKGFIERFPSDPRFQQALDYIRKSQYKIIEKKYQNGYIYYKMKDYSSALMYFDEVIALGNTDRLDRQSLYYSALLHLHQNSNDKAQESFARLKAKYPGSKETTKLSKKFGG